ncbi:hypothetical protein BZG36_02427 [Bifiguratus adelaidae]|uniref:Thioredoxin domain-containing protein n=1 Tax=Bifiguratus adelaidae TaxID=1938954 RepID=A0A261Y3I8_9FUNG|nr:hypothetical protein BZG36_02427 [Bifiguratus adelaidae]
MVHWLTLALALWSVACVCAEVQSLDSESFRELAGNGIWFVEHFAPWCPHCQHFAPTWQQLGDYVSSQKYEKTYNFHVGKIDCMVQGDLCNSHGIKSFPTLFLYKNGEKIDDYNLRDRTFDALKKYVEEQIEKHAPIEDDPNVPNPMGMVKILNLDMFRSQVYDSLSNQWFLEYVGEGKASTTLEENFREVAKRFKGKLNFGKIDCRPLRDLCIEYGVTRLPTLKYFADGGVADYTGEMDVQSMVDYVNKVSKDPLPTLEATNIDDLQKHDVSMIYLYEDDDEEYMRTVKNAARSFAQEIAFYKSNDPAVIKQFDAPSLPSAVLVKDGKRIFYPSHFFKNDDKIVFKAWIKKHKFADVVRLQTENVADIWRSDRVVVLAVTSDHPSDPNQHIIVGMKAVADLYNQKQHIVYGAPHAKQVIFSVVNVDKWTPKVRDTIEDALLAGAKAANIPPYSHEGTVIIADVGADRFFAVDSHGRPMDLTNPEALVNTLLLVQSDPMRLRLYHAFSRSLRSGMHHKKSWLLGLSIVAGLGCAYWHFRVKKRTTMYEKYRPMESVAVNVEHDD